MKRARCSRRLARAFIRCYRPGTLLAVLGLSRDRTVFLPGCGVTRSGDPQPGPSIRSSTPLAVSRFIIGSRFGTVSSVRGCCDSRPVVVGDLARVLVCGHWCDDRYFRFACRVGRGMIFRWQTGDRFEGAGVKIRDLGLGQSCSLRRAVRAGLRPDRPLPRASRWFLTPSCKTRSKSPHGSQQEKPALKAGFRFPCRR